jgi:LysR family transcriptional activator of nhaA
MADLKADLALHRMDGAVQPPGASTRTRCTTTLGASAMGWYAAPYWWEQAQDGCSPASLNRVPVLLPTTHSTVRARSTSGLIQHRLRPRGELEDSALLENFGGSWGCSWPLSVQDDLLQRHQARLLGPCEGWKTTITPSAPSAASTPVVQQLLARAEPRAGSIPRPGRSRR